ncbi:MAG: NAD(+) synthase [Phycisphaerales bacterium]
MKALTVAGAALNLTPMDWGGNLTLIRAAIAEARAQGAGVLCLPEMCIPGYGCEDAFSGADLRRRCWDQLLAILPETHGMAVSVGLPVLYRNALFNCVAMLVDGQLAGLVAKRHLAGEGLHYEPRWFKPWPDGVRSEIETPAGTVPIGDLLFEVDGVRIGLEICEDAWVAQRPGASLAARGVDLILNPSASHFAFGKVHIRERFVIEGSRAFGAGYVYANLLGNEAGRAIYDGGVLIASCAGMIARGTRLSMRDWLLTAATIDLDAQRTAQARTASFQPDVRPDPLTVRCDGKLVRRASTPRAALAPAAWEDAGHEKEEEFTRAIALGLLDYLRKSRSRGFVVSLSGGADSAAMAVLVRMTAQLVELELGSGGLAAKLSRVALKPGAKIGELVGGLLTTVYQAAEGSTDSSRESARRIASAIGARHIELDVGPIVSGYTSIVSKALGRPLAWSSDDLALQNIQARARAPGVWLIANILDALLLATSNRSEAAVGYATMDGDTCGGLSPIAGIDKAFLLKWLRWMETRGPLGVGPLPELATVTARTPTPELRPAAMQQTSEGDLMPYDALEMIEDLAITLKQSPAEVMVSLGTAFPKSGEDRLRGWVRKFYTLWCRNQWKRERYAPSFHVDDHNLDPKTWCRFPILSGGFAEELAELDAGDRGGA